MSYNVIFRHDDNGSFVHCAGPFSSLEEAKAHQKVSGDIVVAGRNTPVTDTSWLWDWELVDRKCYAQEVIRESRRAP